MKLLLMACAIIAMSSMLFAADEPLKLIKTIPLDHVDGRIDHMSMAPDGRLFIAALGNSTVEVLDIESGKSAGRVENIKEPQGVCYLSDSKKLAVASGGDGNVRIYDDSL